MGYDRNENENRGRYGAGPARPDRDDGRWNSRAGNQGQNQYGSQNRDRGDYRERDYGSSPQGYGGDDRGFIDRAGDEVRSWFGDEEAQRRREADDRYNERSRDGGYGSFAGGGGYGAQRRAGAGHGAGASSWNQGGNPQADSWGRDPNYQSWRDRQMADFDRDYQEYRTENQGRFDSEFATWRQNRQTQRGSLQQVREHQEVVGSDGGHIGTVDKVRGDRIILTRTDSDAGGHHHSIPSNWITTVSDKVTIGKTADQAKQHWRDEDRDSGNSWNAGNDREHDRTRDRSPSGN